MNKFPIPPPDRRLIIKKNTYSKSNSESIILNEGQTKTDKEDAQKYNNLNIIRIKHIEEMRNNILNYKVKLMNQSGS